MSDLFDEDGDGSGEGSSPDAGAPAWMASFSDLMTLLFTFFVLLLSFAQMDVVKFRDLLGSLRNAFGQQTERFEPFADRSRMLEMADSAPVARMLDAGREIRHREARATDRRMLREIRSVIAQQGLEQIATAELSDRGVTVRVQGRLLFESAKAELLPDSYLFLDEIARLTKGFSYHVSIQGHTDDLPIHTERFPSNWHLSSARAIAALQYLVDVGGVDPERLSCSGYAGQRPLAPNDSPESRSRNRRVEFVYYRERSAGPRRARPPAPAPQEAAPAGEAAATGGADRAEETAAPSLVPKRSG